MTLGASYLGDGRCCFRVWAPCAQEVSVVLGERRVALAPEEGGTFAGEVEGVEPGARYRFALNGEELPDPASLLQPEGVHGPSEVVDPTFASRHPTATSTRRHRCC